MIADRVGEMPCVFLAGLHRAERTDCQPPNASYGRRAALALDRTGQGIAMKVEK